MLARGVARPGDERREAGDTGDSDREAASRNQVGEGGAEAVDGAEEIDVHDFAEHRR